MKVSPALFLFSATSSLASPFLKRQPGDSTSSGGGFCNAVFNTGASTNAGWPGTTWDSLSSNGISNFIAFCLSPLSTCASYGNPSLPDAMQAAQIPICMNPSSISQPGVNCLNALSGTSPPAYMEIFNEPDYSYANSTPTTLAADAGADVQQLLPAAQHTQLISPAPAFTNSSYLTDFANACNGCMDQIDIIAAHVYSPDPATVLATINAVHTTWPTKKLWITEMSPASGFDQGCDFDAQAMIGWMSTVLPAIKALGYVEKIFWNCGEHADGLGSSPDRCNPSLTNADGSPSELLQSMKQYC